MTTAVRAAGETVERLAEAGATGALRTETGTLYLEEGAVVQVESHRATGLATVLTACGRIPPATWHETVRTFGPERRVGRMLVERGHLTRGELELSHLSALYDAAFFALSAHSTTASFEPEVRHWLGPVNRVGAQALRRETVRRQDLLERIWPWPQLDTSPVVRRRPERRWISPRGRQLLDLADRRRTPAEIARMLGRSTFATTVEVRRLAAAGLVETPLAEMPVAEAAHPPPPLTRRVPGASRPRHSRHPAAQQLSVHDPDVALLTRVLTALEARL